MVLVLGIVKASLEILGIDIGVKKVVLLRSATEIQGHRQVCRARRGGPRTLSTTTGAHLDCASVENALFYTDPLF